MKIQLHPKDISKGFRHVVVGENILLAEKDALEIN